MTKKLITSKLVWFLGGLSAVYGAFHFTTHRTVTWEEEVPLNTGETISVKRSMAWRLLGGFGNPFDIAMRPTQDQTLEFTYGGRRYVYGGRADIRWIAVSPEKRPTLVAPAADYAWASRNSYYCVVPYYVQFNPSEDGIRWSWPEKIEPWLYGTYANLMASIPSLEEERKVKYTAKDRDLRDATYRLQFPEGVRIDGNYKVSGCVTKIEVDMSARPDWTKK